MKKLTKWKKEILSFGIVVFMIISITAVFPNDRKDRTCDPNQTYMVEKIENAIISIFK